MPLNPRFHLALAAGSLLTVLSVAGTASAHDASCATVYQDAPGIQPVPYGLFGSSHDLFNESIGAGPPQFNDLGSYTANLFLQVYASEPVPARPTTWGQVKGAYR